MLSSLDRRRIRSKLSGSSNVHVSYVFLCLSKPYLCPCFWCRRITSVLFPACSGCATFLCCATRKCLLCHCGALRSMCVLVCMSFVPFLTQAVVSTLAWPFLVAPSPVLRCCSPGSCALQICLVVSFNFIREARRCFCIWVLCPDRWWIFHGWSWCWCRGSSFRPLVFECWLVWFVWLACNGFGFCCCSICFLLQQASARLVPVQTHDCPRAPSRWISKASWCVRSGVIVASNGLSPAACASGACPLAAKHKRFPDGSGLGASWQRCWNTLLVGCSVFTYRGGSFDCHAAGRRCGASPLRFVVARCILPSITNNMRKANCNPCHSSSRWIAVRPVCASRFRRWSLPVSTTGRADLRGSWYCRALVSA